MRFTSIHPLQFTDPPATFVEVAAVNGITVYGFETDDPDVAARLRQMPAWFTVAEADWADLQDDVPAEPQDAPVVDLSKLTPGSPAADQLQSVPGAPETATYDTPPVTPAAPVAPVTPSTPAA